MSFALKMNVCRVCMKNEENVATNICDVETWQKFEYTTRLTISPNDELPKIICCRCEIHLRLAYKFIKLAQQSEINLRKFLSKNNNIFDEVTETDGCVELCKNDDDVYEEEFLLSSNNDSDTGDTVEPEEYKKHDEITKIKYEEQIVEISEDPCHVCSEDVIESDISYQKHKVENSTNAVDLSTVNNEFEVSLKENETEESQAAVRLKRHENNLREHDYNLVYLNEESIYCKKSKSFVNFEGLPSNQVAQASVGQATDAISTNSTSKAHHKLNTSVNNSTLPYEHAIQNAEDIEGLLRFYCAECNRDFSTKTNLNRHMMGHRGNKPYICKHCCKSFSQSGSLKQHMYTHTGERPYKCDICRRAFTQSKTLIFHRRRHTGEKPFQCDSCEIPFRQKDALKMHMLRHHIKAEGFNDKTLYSCNICMQFFQTNFDMQHHVQLHINQTQQTTLFSNISISNASGDSTASNKTDDSLPAMGQSREQSEANSVNEFLNHNENSPNLNITLASCEVDVSTCSAAIVKRAKKFKCGKCFKSFAIKMNLQRHLALHDIKKI